MKARIDRTRIGRVWERPRLIQLCKENGTRIGEIRIFRAGNHITISHTAELHVNTHELNGMGTISLKEKAVAE